MKITIKNILLFLQAICLLGGNIVVAMEQDGQQKRGRPLDRSNKQKKQSLSLPRRNTDNFEDTGKLKRSKSQDGRISHIEQNDIQVINDKISKAQKQLALVDNELKEKKSSLNELQIVIQVKSNAAKDKTIPKDKRQYGRITSQWKEAIAKKIYIEEEIKNLELEKSSLEKRLHNLNNKKDILEKAEGIQQKKLQEFNKQKKDAEYKAWLNEQKEDFIGLGKYAAGKAVGVGKGTAHLAKQVAGKTTDAASYVYNSSLINNPLVNTISALGKTVYNTVAGTAQNLEANINQSLDLFGPNLEHNIIKPCAQAQDIYSLITSDDVGKFVLDNSDISASLYAEDEKIRGIQAIIELLVAQYEIKPSEINSDGIRLIINSSLKKYIPIKQLLEKALSTSLLTAGCSVIDALKKLKPEHKTVEKVQEQIKHCTQALEERFAEWKDQDHAKALASVTNELDKKAAAIKLQEKYNLYDAILLTLKEAMTTYGCVFLIQTTLENLAAVDITTIDTAIIVYRKYVEALSDYKKAKNNLDEDDAASLVKEHVSDGNVKKNADLIIKMKSLYKKDTRPKLSRTKRSQSIDTALGNVVSKVDTYLLNTARLLIAAELQPIAIVSYTSGSVKDYLKRYESIFDNGLGLLTTAQQKNIQSIINEISSEAVVIEAMKKQILAYQNQAFIAQIKKLYKKLEHDKKMYKSAPISDTMQDISLEMLTTNRSEGIAELLKTHKSVSKMITWAEKQQVAYGARQTKRNAILNNIYDNAYSSSKIGDEIVTETNSLINNDVAATDEDIHKFDDILANFMAYVECESMRFTAEHRTFIETLAQEAIEDAKQNIKVQIIAGWTVIGVKAKIAFEKLAKTEGSSAKAVATRALGNVLNAGRQGFVAAGKAIAAENYHEETRQEIAEGTKAVAKEFGKGFVKRVKKTAKLAKKEIDLLDDEMNAYQEKYERNIRSSKQKRRALRRKNNDAEVFNTDISGDNIFSWNPEQDNSLKDERQDFQRFFASNKQSRIQKLHEKVEETVNRVNGTGRQAMDNLQNVVGSGRGRSTVAMPFIIVQPNEYASGSQ